MERRYFTLKDLCEYAGLTPATVYSLVYQREIPFTKITNKKQSRLRFDKAEIDKWFKEKGMTLEDS